MQRASGGAQHQQEKMEKKTNPKQRSLETIMLSIGNILLGAANGYQRFDFFWGIVPGALVMGVSLLWINWDSVQFAIKADQRALGRSFWPTVFLAFQAFAFFSLASFVVQMVPFLLVGWLRR